MRLLIIAILTLFGAVGLGANKMEYFIESNHDDLSQEMAQGEGKKLSILAELNGCTSTEAQSVFAEMTRKSFEKIIPAVDTEAKELAQNLQKEISEDDEILQLCKAVGLPFNDPAKLEL